MQLTSDCQAGPMLACKSELGLLLFGGGVARLPRGKVGISILARWKRRTLSQGVNSYCSPEVRLTELGAPGDRLRALSPVR